MNLRGLLVGVFVLTAPRVVSADAGNCAAWLDRIDGYLAAIEKLEPDADAALKMREHSTDVNAGVEQAALCIGRLASGADRTRVERRYQEMQKTVPARMKLDVEQLNEAISLRNEALQLRKQIQAAALGSEHEATVATFEARLAKVTSNRYATAGWRAKLVAAFKPALARHQAARANTAAATEIARLESNTVVARHDGKFTSDDASRQAKIVAAFELATPADLVTANVRTATFAPAANHADDYRHDRQPMQYHGDTETELAFTDTNDRSIRIALRHELPAFPAGVPALVWDIVTPGVAAIVTLDGGRYLVGTQHLRAGVAPAAEWPTQPVHTALLDRDIAALAKISGVDVKQASAVAAADARFATCATSLWTKSEGGFEQIRVANITSSTRTNRLDAFDTKVRNQIRSACAKHQTAFDKAWRSVLTGYEKARAQTLATNRTRLQDL